MIKTIHRVAQALDGVTAVYGMGSYFRNEAFNDVDLVVVVAPTARPLATVGGAIRAAFAPLTEIAGAAIDITIFTESEFADRPLRDMQTLVPIYEAAA